MSASQDVNADRERSEMTTVNASKRKFVLTGIVWQTRHIKSVVMLVWNPLALYLIPLDVSVTPPVPHDANVTKAPSVTNMETVSNSMNVHQCIVLIMKFTQTLTTHVMNRAAQQSTDAWLQLL
jgi:hypothetical protein